MKVSKTSEIYTLRLQMQSQEEPVAVRGSYLRSNNQKRTSKLKMRRRRSNPIYLAGLGVILLASCSLMLLVAALEEPSKEPARPHSTQPTVDRQLDSPSSPSAPSVSPKETPELKAKDASSSSLAPAKPVKPKQMSSSQKKQNMASAQNYDKYQLKATSSHNSTPALGTATSPASDPGADASSLSGSPGASASGQSSSSQSSDSTKDKSSTLVGAHKKAANYGHNGQKVDNNGQRSKSSFSLLKKFLPSFMTSAGPAAIAAVAASLVSSDKMTQMSHSRSSPQSALPSVVVSALNNHHHLSGSSALDSSGSSSGSASTGLLSKASGKIINLLSPKRSGVGAVPDHAPFFVRKASINDRQAAGFASGLLSNPLSLGLLFSAPLIPSLLLTPLAIAGLSPAMSAINNFFGDDEEASTPASAPLAGPLSVLTGGSSSPLSSILQQATGTAPSSSGSESGRSPSFALQAMQSFLGPPATTEKPLFNPGMFASQAVQQMSAPASSSSASSSSGISQPSNSPVRNLLGGSGSLIQTAASMISPSFAAPPSSSSSGSSSSSASSDSDDGPGFMQVASDVFDKVANYMSSSDNSGKDISQAAGSSPAVSQASPLSQLVGLSSFSPFQLSSLFASSPLAAAVSGASGSSHHSSSSSAASPPKVGFFSTLKNVYELFSSSFLRRQEVGDSNECQQRLICEIHQRAMNSKLFRRSVQANLIELANFDRNLQDQMKSNPMQARVDADTKAMLSDFLKATNNFKNGRELVNCSKMFPKCSRTMLLSAANAHLADPASGKTIGKFSNLMKKMKFKSAQQHQQQWKLRKPNKPLAVPVPSAVGSQQSMIGNQYQSGNDYLQVAPMSPIPNTSNKPQAGQLTPVDSLKLVQQILLMSQRNQQQQQQQQQQIAQQSQQVPQYNTAVSQMQQGQQQSYLPVAPSMYNTQVGGAQPSMSQQYPQYQPSTSQQQSQMGFMYADSVGQTAGYMATEAPYYNPSQPQSSGMIGDLSQQPQPQSPQQQQQQQQQQIYQQYPSTSTSVVPEVPTSLDKKQAVVMPKMTAAA